MLPSRSARLGALTAGALAALGTTGVATAAGPPLPQGPAGHPVHLLGQVDTPTSFGFIGHTAFAGGFGPEQGADAGHGGVYVLKGGTATKVPGSTGPVMGVVGHAGKLYSSAGRKITVWTGWDGTKFAHHRVILRGSKKFTGFNGMVFGHGRLYVGVALSESNDHGKPSTPHAYQILSVRPNGKGLRVESRGLRQPYQLAFVGHQRTPLATVLGQDKPATGKFPDWIVRVRHGSNYGFPTCTWAKPAKCAGFSKPLRLLTPHFSAMGIGAIKRTVYLGAFGGRGGQGKHPGVYSMTAGGRHLRQLVSTMAPTVGLDTHGHWVYFGDLTNQVYRIHF